MTDRPVLSGTSPETCFLCREAHRSLTSPSQWVSVEARTYIVAKDIPDNKLVCSACRKDITRVISNSSFVPRWSKAQPQVHRGCSVKECKNDLFSSFGRAKSEQIETIFSSLGLECSYAHIPEPLPLCQQHYHSFYRVTGP